MATETQTGPLGEDEARDLVKSLWADWAAERTEFDLLDRYHSGDHPLPQEPQRLTDAYAEMLQMSVSNWCKLVVDVVAERLEVQSVITGKQPERESTVWQWWQDNNLDFHSNNVHVSGLKHGISYCAVGKPLEGQKSPRIIGQPATQVHVRTDLETGKRIAAIKVWQGRDAKTYVNLYDEFACYRFRSPGKTLTGEVWSPVIEVVETQALELRDDDEGGWLLPNDLQAVPFVPFYCQPDLLGGFTSEIATVIPIQDRINKTTFHRLLAQEFTAFPQRWVTGIDIPTDPVTGEPIEPFQAAVDRLWAATDENTRFGQFPAGSSGDYIASISSDIQALATQSRTPPHYLTGGMGQFPSGESVRATEYGLHMKIRDRKVTFGEAWGDTLRLAAKAAGNQALADDMTLTVRWEDVEARTEGEIVDALLKMSTLGVPLKALWARWGATPDEITEWERLAKESVALAEGMGGLPGTEEAPGNGGNAEGEPSTPKDAANSAF